MSSEPPHPTGPPGKRRLDPDRAAQAADRRPSFGPEPGLDTRRYRIVIGLVGLALVMAASIYELAHGTGQAGIPAGKQLHFFAAPLAASTLQGDANLAPPCSASRHDHRALNICLIVQRTPLVLGFFVTGSAACRREIDTLQSVSRQFPANQVQFAAVAVHTSHSAAASAVRAHHWTIPVAYDSDGAVGAVYGVVLCPMVELAYRGGRVADRLIGDHWLSSEALDSQVRALLK